MNNNQFRVFLTLVKFYVLNSITRIITANKDIYKLFFLPDFPHLLNDSITQKAAPLTI